MARFAQPGDRCPSCVRLPAERCANCGDCAAILAAQHVDQSGFLCLSTDALRCPLCLFRRFWIRVPLLVSWFFVGPVPTLLPGSARLPRAFVLRAMGAVQVDYRFLWWGSPAQRVNALG